MRLFRLLVTGTLLGGLLVLGGTLTASAADSCGSGYHKQEDGGISGSNTIARDGKSMTARETGAVRWCTRSKTGVDQYFQRVVVGVPTGITFRGTFSGTNRTQICESASFTATIAGGNAANISIGTGGVSAGITSTTSRSKTVTLPKRCKSGAAARSTTALQDAMYNFTATAQNYSIFDTTCPHITAVTISTTVSMSYTYGRENRGYTVRSTNTDVPNNYPTFGC